MLSDLFHPVDPQWITLGGLPQFQTQLDILGSFGAQDCLDPMFHGPQPALPNC